MIITMVSIFLIGIIGGCGVDYEGDWVLNSNVKFEVEAKMIRIPLACNDIVRNYGSRMTDQEFGQLYAELKSKGAVDISNPPKKTVDSYNWVELRDVSEFSYTYDYKEVNGKLEPAISTEELGLKLKVMPKLKRDSCGKDSIKGKLTLNYSEVWKVDKIEKGGMYIDKPIVSEYGGNDVPFNMAFGEYWNIRMYDEDGILILFIKCTVI